MFAQTRFFDFSRFAVRDVQSRVRAAFEPRKPRHRLLRFVLGLVGLALVVMLVMFGVVVGATMLTVGLVYRLFVRRAKPVASDPRILDAEYRVVGKPQLSR
jgi:hypothetical protein